MNMMLLLLLHLLLLLVHFVEITAQQQIPTQEPVFNQMGLSAAADADADQEDWICKYLPELRLIPVTETNLTIMFVLDLSNSCGIFAPDPVGIDLVELLELLLDHSTLKNPNKHKETMPKGLMFHLNDDTLNENKPKETANRVSSIFATIHLWCLLMTSSHTLFQKHSETTMINVQPLHKEHGPLSIAVPLLELLGFMVFVWAVATMILAGTKLTRIHTAMFLSCAILMLTISDNSINVMYLPILGIFFMGWYGKATTKAEKFSSTSVIMPEYVMPQL